MLSLDDLQGKTKIKEKKGTKNDNDDDRLETGKNLVELL
jgi:hypothetical protein